MRGLLALRYTTKMPYHAYFAHVPHDSGLYCWVESETPGGLSLVAGALKSERSTRVCPVVKAIADKYLSQGFLGFNWRRVRDVYV